jgi:hypothetical protein
MEEEPTGDRHRGLVLDANVLIDYRDTDLSILSLVTTHVAPVCVPGPILSEVPGLDEATCRDLGIEPYEPTLEELVNAGRRIGSLSFADRLVWLIARDRAWSCVTNEKPLRRLCSTEGVHTLWGLNLVLPLVECGELEVAHAIEVAGDIHRHNPHYITAAIVARFGERCRDIDRTR